MSVRSIFESCALSDISLSPTSFLRHGHVNANEYQSGEAASALAGNKLAVPPSKRILARASGKTGVHGGSHQCRSDSLPSANKFLCIGLMSALLSLGSPGEAFADTDAINPASVVMLPPYCKHAHIYRSKIPGGNDPREVQRWQAVLGSAYEHIHHYCNGLLQTNTALLKAPTKVRRISLLEISIREFDYVIRNVPDDFVLLPEILTKKGVNLIRIDRGSEAVRVMQRAMELKADYWPPYAYLSDYYKDIGEQEKAKAVLKQGLSHSPASKALKSRLTELENSGGKISR